MELYCFYSRRPKCYATIDIGEYYGKANGADSFWQMLSKAFANLHERKRVGKDSISINGAIIFA